MSSSSPMWGPLRPSDPIRIYYVLSVTATFCFTLCFTVFLVYMVVTVGLGPLELILVGTALELTCFLFEVPTGVVADRFSRRLSVLVGFVLIGLGFLLGGSVPTFVGLLASQVLWGIGSTFASGATVAWITDEIGGNRVRHVFTVEQQLSLVAAFAGTVCAGALSLIDLRLPILLAGAGFIGLAIGLALCMPERHFRPVLQTGPAGLAGLLNTTRAGLRLARTRRVVRSLLVISVLVGLASEVFDRLWQLQIIDAYPLPSIRGADNPAVWFAGVALVGIVVSLAASLLVNRLGAVHLASAHPGYLLAVLAALEVLGIVAVAIAPTLGVALAGVWIKGAAGVVAAPVLAAWLNRNVDSGVRATVLSINAQAGAIGQVLGGPPLGLLAGRTSVRLALLVSAGLLAPTVGLFVRLRPPRTPPARA